jgi:hypothetical protein
VLTLPSGEVGHVQNDADKPSSPPVEDKIWRI